jgi:hypothetical protein
VISPRIRLPAAHFRRYISRADPAWQYNAERQLYYHAQQNAFYALDPATGALVVAAPYPPAPAPEEDAGQDGEAEDDNTPLVPAARPEPVPLGVRITADHSFMQGRRPQQEDRHTMEHTFGPGAAGRVARNVRAQQSAHHQTPDSAGPPRRVLRRL